MKFLCGRSLILFLFLTMSFSAQAADSGGLGRFLKNCAWGTVIGAGAGVVSLAFENRPSDHTINIARGASLGLYGGIAYGFAEMNNADKKPMPEEAYGLVPRIERGRLSGIEFQGIVASF